MLTTGDREELASAALARVDALHTGLTQIVLEGGNLDGIAAEVARVLGVGVAVTSTDGRLRAVLDFGSVGAGDPAVDVIPAWSVFGSEGRRAFRAALDVDDATWIRARGLALHQALLIIPYYPDTNPGFVAMAMRTVSEVLVDDEHQRGD